MGIEEGQESRRVLRLAQIKINTPNHKREGVKKGGRARGVWPMCAQLLLRAGKNVKRLKRLKRELTLKKFRLWEKLRTQFR